MASENGWEPSHAPPDLLEWRKIPGTNVQLRLMKGWPSTVMTAFAADYHVNVEPLRDRDSAAFTATNSVPTSNHLNGTAMDLNWDGSDGRTFRLGISEQQAYPGDEARNLRDLLAFYNFEGLQIIFCGGNWSIRDWMHFQMNGNTWKNPKVLRFIEQRTRADGYSTYRRGGPVTPPPPPPPLSRADRYALVIISEGRRLNITPRGIKIALAVGLVETNLTNYANSNDPPSLNLPHDAVGSDHMSVGWAQQQPNWGSLQCRMDIMCAATLFFMCDNGPGTRGLTRIRERINGKDGALYDYNDTSKTPGFYAQKVQGSAFPDRYDQRFAEAEGLYNRLTNTTQPPAGDEDDMIPPDEWRNFYNAYMSDVPSLSPLRHLGEGNVGPLHRLLRNIDGSEHVEIVKTLAMLKHPPSIALLQEVAGADPGRYPDRQGDAKIAEAILAAVFNTPADAVEPVEQARHAALPAVVDDYPGHFPEPVVKLVNSVHAPAEPETTGDIIGRVYEDLKALRLADALPIEDRAPLAALIAVLSTKNGADLS